MDRLGQRLGRRACRCRARRQSRCSRSPTAIVVAHSKRGGEGEAGEGDCSSWHPGFLEDPVGRPLRPLSGRTQASADICGNLKIGRKLTSGRSGLSWAARMGARKRQVRGRLRAPAASDIFSSCCHGDRILRRSGRRRRRGLHRRDGWLAPRHMPVESALANRRSRSSVTFAFGLVVPLLLLLKNGETRRAPRWCPSQPKERGGELFADACAICHTLKATNSVGQIGPNLDDVVEAAKATKTAGSSFQARRTGVRGPTGAAHESRVRTAGHSGSPATCPRNSTNGPPARSRRRISLRLLSQATSSVRCRGKSHLDPAKAHHHLHSVSPSASILSRQERGT